MPPARTPPRPPGKRPPSPPSGGRFARAFGRFNTAQRSGAKPRGTGLVALVRDVRSEMRKVEWPSREEATKLTGAVVGLSAAVGLFLGAVDFIFQEFFKILISVGTGGV